VTTVTVIFARNYLTTVGLNTVRWMVLMSLAMTYQVHILDLVTSHYSHVT